MWNELSFDAKTLLWWTSFNLMCEAQIVSQKARYRMEDVFISGSTAPLQQMVADIFGHDRVADRDWAEVSRAATSKVSVSNRHARKDQAYLTWAQLEATASGAPARTRAAELAAIATAQELCLRYGYSDCGGLPSSPKSTATT